MEAESRLRLSAVLRYAVCAAALAWLYHKTDWGQFKQVLVSADWRLALLAMLVFGPAVLLISVRLKVLLAVQQVHLSVWQAVKVTFAGNFVISALPVGTPGGDSVKAYYVARDTPLKHEAVTAVFFDRAVGVLGLLLMAGVIVLADWDNPAFRVWGRVIGFLLLVLVVSVGLYASASVRRALQLWRVVAILPLSRHIHRVDKAIMAFRQDLGRVAVSMCLTFVLQTISIAAYFLGGWALGVVGTDPWTAFPVYLAYTPICLLTGALPIGVMELTFQELFAGAAGLGSPEAALSLSFFGRLIQLIWAVPGGLVVLRSRADLKNAGLDAAE
ncbi:MAG: flippase-like domain-containing protein [Phycisphaerae bacterium]|nr:flippase-like domain-containing protein [Phycisphaerae bacterium]